MNPCSEINKIIIVKDYMQQVYHKLYEDEDALSDENIVIIKSRKFSSFQSRKTK